MHCGGAMKTTEVRVKLILAGNSNVVSVLLSGNDCFHGKVLQEGRALVGERIVRGERKHAQSHTEATAQALKKLFSRCALEMVMAKLSPAKLERRKQLDVIRAIQAERWHALPTRERQQEQLGEISAIEKLINNRLTVVPRNDEESALRASTEINKFVLRGIVSEGDFDETHFFIEGADAEGKRFRAEHVLGTLKNYLDGNDARATAAKKIALNQLTCHWHPQIRRTAFSHISELGENKHRRILKRALQKESDKRAKTIMQTDFASYLKKVEEKEALKRREEMKLV